MGLCSLGRIVDVKRLKKKKKKGISSGPCGPLGADGPRRPRRSGGDEHLRGRRDAQRCEGFLREGEGAQPRGSHRSTVSERTTSVYCIDKLIT